MFTQWRSAESRGFRARDPRARPLGVQMQIWCSLSLWVDQIVTQRLHIWISKQPTHCITLLRRPVQRVITETSQLLPVEVTRLYCIRYGVGWISVVSELNHTKPRNSWNFLGTKGPSCAMKRFGLRCDGQPPKDLQSHHVSLRFPGVGVTGQRIPLKHPLETSLSKATKSSMGVNHDQLQLFFSWSFRQLCVCFGGTGKTAKWTVLAGDCFHIMLPGDGQLLLWTCKLRIQMGF